MTEWNPVFAYATLEMGIGVELCWPYRAQQKGSVENLVGFVKSSFFKVRRFHDEQDLRAQLRDWHREVNEERASRATGVIPALRLAERLLNQHGIFAYSTLFRCDPQERRALVGSHPWAYISALKDGGLRSSKAKGIGAREEAQNL